jgi:hypothetical protein
MVFRTHGTVHRNYDREPPRWGGRERWWSGVGPSPRVRRQAGSPWASGIAPLVRNSLHWCETAFMSHAITKTKIGQPITTVRNKTLDCRTTSEPTCSTAEIARTAAVFVGWVETHANSGGRLRFASRSCRRRRRSRRLTLVPNETLGTRTTGRFLKFVIYGFSSPRDDSDSLG